MARGGVVIRGATPSAYELTAPGTAGQVLTSNGAGANPTFQATGAEQSGYWSPLTNGDVLEMELISADGDTISCWTPT